MSDEQRAYRTYAAQLQRRLEGKRDEIDQRIAMHDWDLVRSTAIDLAAIACSLCAAENKLADFEP